MINESVVVEINASAYTPVRLPTGVNKLNNKFNPISAYTSPRVDFYISSKLLPAVDPIVLSDTIYNNASVKMDIDGTIFYAKSGSGTVNLIVHVGLEERSRNRD